MCRCEKEIYLQQEPDHQRAEVRNRQRRVHRHTKRANVLGNGRGYCAVCRSLRGCAREPVAVNMRSLRNPGHADQQRTKQSGHPQPDRPRRRPTLALGKHLHATSSMTRIAYKQTPSPQKCRFASRHTADIPCQLFSTRVTAGTISKRSPTAATSATSKIGASGSLLMAITVRAPFMPTRC